MSVQGIVYTRKIGTRSWCCNGLLPMPKKQRLGLQRQTFKLEMISALVNSHLAGNTASKGCVDLPAFQNRHVVLLFIY